ncbi:acyl-CoA desaturase [Streptomyces sp. NBC_00102]|uniref:acyl-CoA desaturase n=1 Tax=Streptomyces sp. NBC_00102 TaxID=2975652 RepID=UPI0022588AA9|nr:acyl-CoA desaturase [Streptomyces sp. NBC_00102]MCX5395488.1 acyl-CoA desaturase [Streptomyces sp. NBC_00102]
MSRPGRRDRVTLYAIIGLPFAAILAAVPVAWGWGIGWTDVVIAVAMYCVTMLGVSMGFHRYFTHGAFKANKALHTGLAVAGSLALQGPPIAWVADHRMHHKYADATGDPHSPWRFGTSAPALAKGMAYAHVGWLLGKHASFVTYAPDLLRDPVVVRVSRGYWRWVSVSVLLPPLLGALLTWSWSGALTAFFWGSLVRIGLVHHVEWSINSICHVAGDRPFAARDKSGNVWWLALLTFGDAWHNLHHAEPTSARHGVLRGQIDIAARVIRWCESAGLAWDVRWPDPVRLARRRVEGGA